MLLLNIMRISLTIVMLIVTFLTERVIVPGLVNAHNDGLLIAAFVVAVAVPIAVAAFIYLMWTIGETE